MMRAACISLWIVVCLCAGCGAGNRDLGSASDISITPLFSTAQNSVKVEQSGESLILKFAPLSKAGSFYALTLPAGTEIASESWSNEATAVHLLVTTDEGAELGIVPTPSYSSGELIARFRLAPASHGKRTSAGGPPVGRQNAVTDLTVAQVAPGKVQLDWTEVNVGDYDLNGEVNISDLTPLGINFGRSVTPGDPVAVADGDGNGTINIADITPIGANFGHMLFGYLVKRNGVAVLNGAGGLPSVIRGTFSPFGGHPHYTLSADGTTADVWVVSPVDDQNTEGEPSSGSQSQVYDATVGLSISGSGLLLTDGSGSSPFGPGTSILRIIEDGDLPYHWDPGLWVGTVYGDGGSYSLDNIPPGVPLLLDICYAPAIDLNTGGPKGASSARGVSNLTEADYVITSIPFIFEEGTQPSFGVNIEMFPQANPEDGYYIDLKYAINGQSAPASGHLRLDYFHKLVASDNDQNSSFDNDPWLDDADRDCISDARLLRNKDDADYALGNIIPLQLYGTISSFDEASGVVQFSEVWYIDGTPFPNAGDVVLHFTELTGFGEHNDVGPELLLDPSSLGSGSQITSLQCWEYTYPAAGLPPRYWADHITKGHWTDTPAGP